MNPRTPRSDRATMNTAVAHPAMSRPPIAASAARLGWSTRGTARIAATSATVTCAITTSASGPSSLRSCSIGSTTAAEPEARMTAYTAAWPVPVSPATTRPPSGAAIAATPAASAPAPRAPRRRRSRSGTCMPTVSINMAKPTSAKNDTVALSEWMRSRPLRPRMTPATSSPTTTGTNARRLAAHSGPARPAATISASWPKPTRRAYAHHDSPTDPEIEPRFGRRPRSDAGPRRALTPPQLRRQPGRLAPFARGQRGL